MSENVEPDWDPRSEAVLHDQLAAYDEMRERCPVAYSDFLGWSVFRHADVTRILHDPETFSSAVSRHVAIPAGMDAPEHTVYRRLIDPYFAPDRKAAVEPACRGIAADLVGPARGRGPAEVMADLAVPFAVRAQCAFLGWPVEVQQPLADWTRRNYEATLVRDREAMADLAREFEDFVVEMLEARRRAGGRVQDVTASLMRQEVRGRPLGDREIVNILRTWTVGEIGSIAASIGILIHFLAGLPDLQDRLRGDRSLLPSAIDEILRVHGPLVASRRVTTRPVEIGGRRLGAGERVSLNWLAANRDGRVFDQPDVVRLDRDPSKNLLYGTGIHVCPGAPLARMEMRVALTEVLDRTTRVRPDPARPAVNAVYPASGFAAVSVLMQ